MITVKKLIEQLLKMDQRLPVVFSHDRDAIHVVPVSTVSSAYYHSHTAAHGELTIAGGQRVAVLWPVQP